MENSRNCCEVWGTHLFNDGWEFTRQPLHTPMEQLKEEDFAPVGLPHDWLIYQGKALYEDGTGYYRRHLEFHGQEQQKVLLRFDGIYMDSKIYVNGQKAGEWKYGYSAFEVDLTEYLREGDNVILVRVDFQAPNSRWYSGAGIYRNVWLKVLHQDHLVSDGIYIKITEQNREVWRLHVGTEVMARHPLVLVYELIDPRDGTRIGDQALARIPVSPREEIQTVCYEAELSDLCRWDVEDPHCYQFCATLMDGERVLQRECQTIGFRTIHFSPEQGFLLNGRKLKLNGVCEHHDLGCLGAAYHTRAMERKFRILKSMGVNAIRLTHNMPAADVMELADRMGILAISEAFDMWERSKTPYDYARFFPQWYKKDVRSWIRRDRNHPSLIMWSIGNEIYDTHADERGQELTRMLMQEVRIHDPKENAPITIGSNYMPWENARKCADLVKLAGYNYAEKYYDEHHREHPDWIIYGSETSSTVQSRGIYHFPYQQSVLADEDEQCSSLGNSTTSWGAASSEACIRAERDHAYSCGQFLWTGFDYIGEPTPYHTRNSYFGQVDTAGFPKDSFYIYQAEWTDYHTAPMVHIFPYWDFNENQLIDVRVCSNAPYVELFLNGRSEGVFHIDHEHGEQLLGHWQLPYTRGKLEAKAYDEAGHEIASEVRASFGEAAKIRLTSDVDTLKGDGQDLAFITIQMEDEDGHPVENAVNRVQVEVSGEGRLVGLDNGDSTDTGEYKGCTRRLFAGKLLLVAAAGTKEGALKVTVRSKGMEEAYLVIPVLEAKIIEGSSPMAYQAVMGNCKGSDSEEAADEIPVRTIYLTSENGMHLHEENQQTVVHARICPADANDRELIWSIVNDAGIPSTLAEVKAEGEKAVITAKSDGQFRLRCMSKSGTSGIRVISVLEFNVTGMGEAYLNPYEFISAGLYDYSQGAIGNGNEHGVATARDGESQVGFHGINFGAYGSDEITIPVFALDDDPCEILIYEGMPEEEGSELVGDVIYQKPSIWNVYQEETFHLKKRLTGITSLCFVLRKKIHIKGFSFTRRNRAYMELTAAECDQIYGDTFTAGEQKISGIGNNVTIEFHQMEFGEKGAAKLILCGYTPNEKNTIQLRLTGNGAEERQMLEFLHTEEASEQMFEIENITGTWDVSFVFLPGSNFDFHRFRFCSK
ncbi:MAG: DUF4982 domain-containing protein [Fusicatenibacter sp.]|nr:DUF4982 domain-containing protein [Fusicatenibacter sp.]